MKYVMMARNVGSDDHPLLQCEPIIFGNNMVHADIAAAFIAIPGNEAFQPVSAGEVEYSPQSGVCCFGESTTLNLKAHERDAVIIDLHDYGGGLVDIR